MAGVQENRVRTGLAGAKADRVSLGAGEWQRCAVLLETVRYALSQAGRASEALGGQTGPALGKKFHRTSDRVDEKAKELRKGSVALTNAANVIVEADEAVAAMEEKYNSSEPAAFTPKPTWQLKSREDVEDEKDRASAHQAEVRAYQADLEARERISRHWADRMDAVFEESTITMKEIHGIPDPEPSDPGGPGGTRPTPIDTRPGTPQGPRDPSDPDDPRDPRDDDPRDPRDEDPRDDDPRDDDPGNDDSGSEDGDDRTGIPPIYTDHDTEGGGLGAGTLGGLAAGGAAGALALGRLRGGLVLPSALSSTGARPIGSTGRVGASGALGRSGALAPGSPVSRGTAGRGAAGRGVGAGGVGTRGNGKQAGGRGTGRGGRVGAGGIGTGRGAGKKDEEKKQAPRDLFDDGEDWIDDEGAAPDVLS